MNLKVGDKVKRVAGKQKGMVVGDVGTITAITPRGNLSLEEYESKHDASKFEAVTARKKAKPTHLVIWEEDEDPVKFFHSVAEANEFIKTLINANYVKNDSIILVDIKAISKVSVSNVSRKTAFTI